MRWTFLSFAALGAVAGTLAMSSCGGSNSSSFGDLDGGDVDATNMDALTQDDAPLFQPGDGSSDGTVCQAKCSSDLHNVLDCNNNVIQTCSGTDGCDIGTGQCTNACTAAVNNKQSVGCDYYATHMETYAGAGDCFAAFVANTWNTPVHITVEFNGTKVTNIDNFTRIPQGSGQSLTYQPYSSANGLAAGQVAILFLGGNQGSIPLCPAPTFQGTAAMYAPSGGTGNGGHSFHVTTDVPVVAYEMNPYGGGSVAVTGASLLLPVSAWDTNYIASTASPQTVDAPSINIISATDNNKITFLPSVALAGGNGVPAAGANSPVTFTLNKGGQAQIKQSADLVGSVISSSAPIGVMAGNPCMNVPQGTIFCDHGEQMIPPVRALGSEYVGVMYRPRAGEPAIWRVVGAVDGTQLTYTPQIAGAPATLKQGQMAEFTTGTPFVVKSQDDKHPFELFAYMSGSNWAQMQDKSGYGDPDFAVMVPPQQYMNQYVIMTDPTFPETNLVVVRRKDQNDQFQDVTLDCLKTPLTGWQTVGNYQWTRQDLSTGDFQSVSGCSNGRHELKSNAPFGLWVWGWGTPKTTIFTANVSYAYPGGMNVQPINTVVIPPTPH